MSAVATQDAAEIRRLLARLSLEDPFLFSFLADSATTAAELVERGREATRLSSVLRARLDSLKHWWPDRNETVNLIRQGTLKALDIKAHVRAAPETSAKFYADQSDNFAVWARSKAVSDEPRKEDKPIAIGDHFMVENVNHAFRWAHALSVIETIFGFVFHKVGEKDEIRWLDIACGAGEFANRANPRKFCPIANWRIVGCDFQYGKIRYANRTSTQGRSFHVADAFDILDTPRDGSPSFHIVSFFELLEHLDDPARFLNLLRRHKPTFLIAASPRAQNMMRPWLADPDHVHYWSFSRQGWQDLFEYYGFEVLYMAEQYVGEYIGGLDWLSIVCGPRTLMKELRTVSKAGGK